MAKKKQEESSEGAPEGALVTAAKAVGTAAGKVAAAVGVTAAPKRVKVPQLKKKNKSRLPRRQKKALQKAGKL